MDDDPTTPTTALAELEMPEALPVFPLTGTLLLPGSWLPLHVFEPRYRSMVEDAMDSHQLLGMVQPRVPRNDHRGPMPDEDDDGTDLAFVLDPDGDAGAGPLDGGIDGGSEGGGDGSGDRERARDEGETAVATSEAEDPPRLYDIGCAGRIERCRRLPDGRYVLALLGITRFRIVEELPLHRGYRRVRAEWEHLQTQREPPALAAGPERLLQALREFSRRQGISLDASQLEELPEDALINGLSMALPFGPAEKQALLEAGPEDREDVLVSLLEMGMAPAAATAPN